MLANASGRVNASRWLYQGMDLMLANASGRVNADIAWSIELRYTTGGWKQTHSKK